MTSASRLLFLAQYYSSYGLFNCNKHDISAHPCPRIPGPAHGSVACNGWNSNYGEICTIFCESDKDMFPASAITTVYVCGATGTWFPAVPDNVDCQGTLSLACTHTHMDAYAICLNIMLHH